MMDRKALFAFFVLLVLGVVVYTFKNPPCSQLGCLRIDLSDYKRKEVFEKNISSYRALYENSQGDLLRVQRKSVPRENIKKVLSSETQKVEAFFENSISPYPGQISDQIECPEEFVPEKKTKNINGEDLHYFEIYLTERMTLGVCSGENAYYKEVLAWYQCGGEEDIYQLEFISKKDRYDKKRDDYLNILNSLECK